MGLFKSVSGIAKSSLGSVSKVRSIYDANPGLMGLAMPPQVSMGLKAANIVGGAFGVKVPTEQEILGFAGGKLDNLLGGVRAKAKLPLADIEATIRKVARGTDFDSKVLAKTINLQGLTPEEILNRIDWLL